MSESPNPNIIEVSEDVFEFITNVQKDDPETATSIDKMVKLARAEGLKEVAKWIRNNPIAYGLGHWNGFKAVYEPPENQDKSKTEPEYSKSDQPKRKSKRKRKRIPPSDNEGDE